MDVARGTYDTYSTSSDSRVQELFRIQEVVLEYSLFVVVLGCFCLVSITVKILGSMSVKHDFSATI